MNNDPRGSIVQQGNTLRIDNALVEDIFCRNNSTGNLIISYSAPEANQLISIQTIQLNINSNTTIIDSFGRNVNLCSIQTGMWVNAIFSSRITGSLPPQSNAFIIIVKRQPQPQPMPSVTTDRIASVDTRNNFIYTGNPNNLNSQIRFVLSNSTPIKDRFGNPISIRVLRPGQMVRITHASFMTASIPPQTTAYSIQLL